MNEILDFELTNKVDSIELHFASKFEKLCKYPMDNQMAKIFVKLLMCKDSSYCVAENEKPTIYQIMEKRIASMHTFKVDDRILLFLSFICKTAGISIMYCWYLQYQSKKRNIKEFTFEDFADIFQNGFPSEEALESSWISQKVNRQDFSSDNLLDYKKAGESLF